MRKRMPREGKCYLRVTGKAGLSCRSPKASPLLAGPLWIHSPCAVLYCPRFISLCFFLQSSSLSFLLFFPCHMYRHLLTPAIWGREKAYLSEKWVCRCILFIITQKEGCGRYDLFSQFFRSRFKSHSHVRKIFHFVYNSQDVRSSSVCGLTFQHVSLLLRLAERLCSTRINLTPGCILSLSVPVL